MAQNYISNVQGLDIYKFSEYPFVIGDSQSTVALCIVWQSLDSIIKYHPDLKKMFAIIGNLRSAFGINIILYNLALNPHIQKVLIWGPDKLSNTAIGIVGKESFMDLWQHGVTANRAIKNQSVKLVDTLNLKTLRKLGGT